MSASYLYESAKDVLKWHNLSVKDNIFDVMQIGNLIYLDDAKFESIKNSSEFIGVSVEDLEELYKD